jgi:ATP-dependent RNA helicase DDX47/RRP3
MPALKKRKISHEKLIEKEALSDDASSSNEDVSPSDAEESQNEPKTFKDLGLIPQLCDACDALGYKAPTAIQSESIPLALQVCGLIYGQSIVC